MDAGALSELMRFDATLGTDIPEPYEIIYDMEVTAEHDYGGYSSRGKFTVSIPLRAVAGWPPRHYGCRVVVVEALPINFNELAFDR